MQFDILTIFTEYFDVLGFSLLGKAIEEGKFAVNVVDIRDFSQDKHKKTDDTPYGGGAGMVMTPDPIVRAIEAADPNHEAHRIYMSPRGKTLNQSKVESLAKKDRILLLCGDYEGIDERVIDLCIDEEVSIGDYVLTGGELPALVLINSVARYIDGVLGSSESTSDESFSKGLLEYPQYTRPEVYRGLRVPEVLLGGNHNDISRWRKEKSIEITMQRRPDLLANMDISPFMPKKPKKRRK
ncbi:MAG: tRNA (guanosine(37)-N1)-methyltransferase TrmD [Clostridia bacterium]|nr:tRNA (guanosine(37)-N1)-methyltransferase TrmD [Clostridia bacterium]